MGILYQKNVFFFSNQLKTNPFNTGTWNLEYINDTHVTQTYNSIREGLSLAF